MKRKFNNQRSLTPRGYSLLEVLIAMGVFGFGILAFMQLQGALNRANLDARIRTLAANIAEEHIETQKHFTRLAADEQGLEFTYENISTGTSTVTRGGIAFTIEQTVTDYYWDRDSGQFTQTAPRGAVFSDFKRVDIAVSWDDSPEFLRGDQAGQTVRRLGSGEAEVSTVISSRVTATNHLALLDELAIQNLCTPLVDCPYDGQLAGAGLPTH